jgi:hypothetical protein
VKVLSGYLFRDVGRMAAAGPIPLKNSESRDGKFPSDVIPIENTIQFLLKDQSEALRRDIHSSLYPQVLLCQ